MNLLCGAAEGTRTPDPIITNDALYHLSYSGIGRAYIIGAIPAEVLFFVGVLRQISIVIFDNFGLHYLVFVACLIIRIVRNFTNNQWQHS